MIVEFEMSVGGGSDVIVWAEFDDGALLEYTVTYLKTDVLDILSLDQVSRIETALYGAYRQQLIAREDDAAFEREVQHAQMCHALRYGGEVI
tara:strand:+ start:1299 stop:1574 length:276 start_codon:yes stop_codon:yes gene_type:complete